MKKRLMLLPILLLAAVTAISAASDPPRVTRTMLIEVEKSLDSTISKSATDNPFLLLGTTRGVYLEGYGAVFSAEINLVFISPAQLMFKPITSKQDIAAHRQKKLSRIPELKRTMRDALISAASSLPALPEDEQVTLVVMLARYQWEDGTGLPQQVLMQATKKQILDAKANPAQLDSAIRVIEN